MKSLKISKQLQLPLEAVTQTFAILAKKGSGKSYTASVMAEEMLKANQQIVVVDPTGAWWGLKSSADGKKEGFPVVVFGGDHADIPLNEKAGEVIATAIVEKRFSCILDVSLLRKGEANRFMGLFLETLYRLNREPMHLFVDEADAFAPQKTFGDDARTLGAMEDIVRRGRKRGIGCTLITQRPAVINKNVLTQCEVLFALRLSHPRDINAAMEWVNVQADTDQATKMISQLPSLPIGTAWFWSPGWMNMFEKITVRLRETFDSGATPKPGEKILQPKQLAKVDIASLGKSIEEIVENKKADDPKLLKQQLASLEKLYNQVLKKLTENPYSNQIASIKNENEELKRKLTSYEKTLGQIDETRKQLVTVLSRMPHIDKIEIKIKPTEQPETKIDPAKLPQRDNSHLLKPAIVNSDEQLGKCERAILIVLAQRDGKPSTKSQVGILAGYSPSSGGFNNALSKLRQRGYITNRPNEIEITFQGMQAVGDYKPLPKGPELHQYWINKLGKCEGAILSHLLNCGGHAQTKEPIGEATQYSSTSGGFNNALSKLRTLELIEGKGEIRVNESLLEG